MTKCRLAFIFALGLLVAPASSAETKPEPVKTPAAERVDIAVFQALSEADRRDIQDALGWLGFYNGTVDGAFGKRSVDSLAAYQQSIGATPGGVPTAQQIADLKEAARKAKAAVGFQVFDDPASGVRIGAPLKWLDKRERTPGAARLASKDGAITLDLVQSSGALADLYSHALADAPGRKIAYKAMKPDAFFVVAGEEGKRKFYRRVAKAPGAAPDPTVLRGFTFAYPADRAKALDPIVLAIANAFEPFPATPLPAPTPAPTPAAPPAPKLAATALVIGKGAAVTFLSPADCAAPLIGGKPARFAGEAGAGLARLEGEFGGAAPALAASAGGGDLMVLSFAPAGAGKAALQIADAQALAPERILVALDPSARGAPVLDRRGGLAGLVSPLQDAAARRGGVALSAPHAYAPPATLGGLLALGPSAAGAPLGAAEIANMMRNSLVAVFCAA